VSSLSNVIPDEVCGRVILDLGCGYGRSMYVISERCTRSYIVGIDIDCSKLAKALKNLTNRSYYDLICSDISKLPLRNNSISSASAILTLHEVSKYHVNLILEELLRVMKHHGILLIIDKVITKFSTPSEELTIITEEAYHKSKEYSTGYKSWGVRKPSEIIDRITQFNFMLIRSNIVKVGKWISGNEFLKSWGKETLHMYKLIKDPSKKKEVEILINRVKSIAKNYGYGPHRLLIAIFRKIS